MFFMLCNLIDKYGRRLLGFRVLELISFDSLCHLACKTQPFVNIKFYVTESCKLLCVYIFYTDRWQNCQWIHTSSMDDNVEIVKALLEAGSDLSGQRIMNE